MKHFNLLIAICASAALLASCTKEMQEETKRVSSVDWESIVIKGTQEGGGITKTSVDGTTGKVYWSPGDEITVFLGTAGAKYVGQNTEKAATTTFVCSSSVVIGSTEGSGDNLYGLYPYDANASCDGSTITTTLPETQKAKEGTFRDSLFITVGKATVSNPTMGFYNVCGGVRFSVTTEGITSVKFKGNNDEILAGKVKISLGNDNIPVVSEVVDGKKEVTLTCAEGFKTGVMYYITTLPATLTNGYTMTFVADNLTGILTVNSAAEIKRSVFGTRENADENVVFDGIVNFSSDKFKAYCVTNFDKNEDGEISFSEAESVDSITFDTYGVKTLEGIEAFVNLKYLVCSAKLENPSSFGMLEGGYGIPWRDEFGLESLDLSKNTALTYLDCSYNIILDPDLSNNTELTYLNCAYNYSTLGTLDLSNNTKLNTLQCRESNVRKLDTSKNTELTFLDCSGCKNLRNFIDVTNNTALTELYCSDCGGYGVIPSLDITNCTALKKLDCSWIYNLSIYGLNENTILTYLNCSHSWMTSLDVSNKPELTYLSCGESKLTDLDVSQNTALTYLDCGNGTGTDRSLDNQLTSLDVSQNTALTYLNCGGNQLTSINLSNNVALTELNCAANSIPSVDVSNCAGLETLTWGNGTKLFEIWLKAGQIIPIIWQDSNDPAYEWGLQPTLKYKEDGGESEPVTFENL